VERLAGEGREMQKIALRHGFDRMSGFAAGREVADA
jgi:hypothetical protein